MPKKLSTLPDLEKCGLGLILEKNILLITPLVQWYMKHGLVITKVYEFIKFFPEKCF